MRGGSGGGGREGVGFGFIGHASSAEACGRNMVMIHWLARLWRRWNGRDLLIFIMHIPSDTPL